MKFHETLTRMLVLSLVACGGQPTDTGKSSQGSSDTHVVTQAAASSPYGVNLTDVPPVDRDAVLNEVAASGVGWIRLTAYWYELQPDGPDFEPTKLNNMRELVAAARARNLEVFVTIFGTPYWAQGCTARGQGCDDPTYPPTDNNWWTWQNLLLGLRQRFTTEPYRVAAWGIWNEPNSEGFFKVRDGRNRLEEYRKFLWYGVQELRDAGGLAVAPDVAQSADMYQWVDYILATEGHRIDVVSVHQYNRRDCSEQDMLQVRRIVNKYGGRPVWLTEFGYQGNDFAGQTKHLYGTLTEMLDYTDTPGCEWRSPYLVGDSSWEKSFYFHMYADDGSHVQSELIMRSGAGWYRTEAYQCLSWLTGASSYRPANCVWQSGY